MFGKTLCATLVLISTVFASAVHAADDPTLHQVYAAAEAGQFAEAQRMMDVVLRDHPDSAKAHFVEAELLAKQGRMADAAVQLNKAEGLAPGLPFAKSESVQNLKRLIAGSHNSLASSSAVPATASASGGISWAGLLLGGGIIAAIIYGLRAIFSRRSAPTYISGNGNASYTGGPQMGQVPPTMGGSPGMGSTILGGLATGAAVGAGMVAGEALVHHLLDGGRHDGDAFPQSGNTSFSQDDMGGTDFGIDDSSSWDDSSSGGGDDSW